MSSFNPFATDSTVPVTETVAVAPEAAIEAAVAPQPTTEAAIISNAPQTAVVDGKEVKLTKTGKVRKPRQPNTTVSKEAKAEILKRYASETCAQIAASLNLESRQVYNVVRNTRIKLEETLAAETDAAKRAQLEAAIAKLPHKEFGGGASGPRSNTLSNDDILATLLG
jgi:hypothetical protein